MIIKFEECEDVDINDVCCLKLFLMIIIYWNDSYVIYYEVKILFKWEEKDF